MKIIFDTRTTHQSGIYRYTTSLAKEIIPLFQKQSHDLFIIYDIIDQSLEKKAIEYNIPYIYIETIHPFTRIDINLRKYIKEIKADLYYTSHYLCDLELGINFVFTIHDLIRIHYPEHSYSKQSFIKKFGQYEYDTILKELKKFPKTSISKKKTPIENYFYLCTKKLIQKSKKVTTVSISTKKDIMNTLDINQNNISVISGAADELLDLNNNLFNKTDIPTKYYLYVGNTNPHKGVYFIIENFEKINNFCLKLILVISNKQQANRLKEKFSYNKNIIILNNISNIELSSLYKYTDALLIASVKEGFCLPALEAAYFNTPIISSRIEVIEEILGDYPNYYKINDSLNFQRLLILGYKKKLHHSTNNAIYTYTWNNSSKKLYNLLTTL